MSEIKKFLEENEIESVVYELLEQDSSYTIENLELYQQAGGEATFEIWRSVYGHELLEKWFEDRGDEIFTREVIIQSVDYTFGKYIEWVRNPISYS